MQTKVEDILFLISEKKLLETIQHAYELSTIAKTFIHTNAAFYCLKLLGSLLMHLKYSKDAINIFTTMRDLGYELLNWSYVIQAFDLLAKALQRSSQYEEAVIAYKKMLQLAWVTNSQEYEILAYQGLSKQLFYMQQIKRSEFYLKRALTCELEPKDSRQRTMSILQFDKFLFQNLDIKVQNWSRLGYKIDGKNNDNIVDATQTYDEANELIAQFSDPSYKRTLDPKILAARLFRVSSRKFGNRVVPLFGPCSVAQEKEVQSPTHGHQKKL